MTTESVQISMEGVSVMIGMPTSRDLPVATVKSFLATHDKCLEMDIPIAVSFIVGSAIITKARDEVIESFLASDASHLFWIDSDMVWDANDFVRLLAVAQKVDVVGGAYPAKIDGQPTFFVKYDKENGITGGDYGLLEVEGLGLGFTVMSRSVIKSVVKASTSVFDEISGRTRPSVFRVDSYEGKFRSEDMAFFHDIRGLGYKVWLDPEVNLGHVGTKQYTGSIKDALQIEA